MRDVTACNIVTCSILGVTVSNFNSKLNVRPLFYFFLDAHLQKDLVSQSR